MNNAEHSLHPLTSTQELLENAYDISLSIPELLGTLRWMEGKIDPKEPFAKMLYAQYFDLLEQIKICCNRNQATQTLGNAINLLARTNVILQIVLPDYYKVPMTPEELRVRDNLMNSLGITTTQSAEVPKNSETDA